MIAEEANSLMATSQPPADLHRTSTPVQNRSPQKLQVDIHGVVGDDSHEEA